MSIKFFTTRPLERGFHTHAGHCAYRYGMFHSGKSGFLWNSHPSIPYDLPAPVKVTYAPSFLQFCMLGCPGLFDLTSFSKCLMITIFQCVSAVAPVGSACSCDCQHLDTLMNPHLLPQNGQSFQCYSNNKSVPVLYT